MKINNNTSLDLRELEAKVDEFYPYSKDKLGFEQDPESLNFISDPENAADMLGKTAYYDPDNFSITIYTDNRHPKDILRSLSHELVHHAQNLRGEFDNLMELEDDYAQTNKHMRLMEKEAYSLGNIVFRDWTDSLNKGVNENYTYRNKYGKRKRKRGHSDFHDKAAVSPVGANRSQQAQEDLMRIQSFSRKGLKPEMIEKLNNLYRTVVYGKDLSPEQRKEMEQIMNSRVKSEMMATPDTTRDAVQGEDNSLEMELFPEVGNLEEDYGVGTVALGTMLGILGTIGVGHVAGMALSILRDAGRKAQARANNERRRIEVEFQEEVANILSNDEGFVSLLKQYKDLVDEVADIKGMRGPEYKEIRQRRKDVSKELSQYIESKSKDVFSQVNPDVRDRANKHKNFNYTTSYRDGVNQAKNTNNLNEVRKMKKAKLEEMILEYCQTKNFKTLAEIRQVKAIAEKIMKENKAKGDVANLYEEPVTEDEQLEEDSIEEIIATNGMDDGNELQEEDELYEDELNEEDLEEISKPTGPKSRGRDEPDRRHRMENKSVPARKSAKRINESKYDKKFKDLIEKWCK
tara:strand:+ start:190 stop:1914 length:1725 start_codon:yes stop_codon:yes gene_type:complete